MLVHTWLDAELQIYGHNEQQAREQLNLSLQTKYRHGNVYAWKNGVSPAKEVRHYMLRRCLKWYIDNELPKLKTEIENDLVTAIHALL